MTKNHLSFIYALALSTGMVLVLMLGVEPVEARPVEARTVCPLPKVLVRLELPNGTVKNMCVPAHSAAKPGGKDGKGADLGGPGDGTSLATDIFASVAKAAAGKAAGAATGWVLGALGLTSGTSDEVSVLNNLSDQLSSIENTLSSMLSEVEDIDKAIKIETCDNFIGSTQNARALIDSLTGDYNNFLTDAVGIPGITPPSIPPIDDCATPDPRSCLVNWAAAVLDDSTTTSGILNAVNQIHEAMIEAGNQGGIITSCLDPTLLEPPQVGENDVDYYDSVASLMNVFYNYQTRGMLLLVEAQHFVAWNIEKPAGDPFSDPSSTSDICTKATNSSVINACNGAISNINDIHANLQAQYLLAGAPYIAADTADSYLLVYTAAGEATLLAKSLEDFTAAAGEACDSPLTSAAPCGLTVGKFSSATNPFGVSYGFYDPYKDWRPVTEPELKLLLSGQGQTQTPGEYLTSLGFENMHDKIVITGTAASFSLGYPNVYYWANGSAVCFMDTDIPKSLTPQPVCNNQEVRDLLGSTGTEEVCPDGFDPTATAPVFGPNPNLPGSRNGFYDVRLEPRKTSDGLCAYVFTDVPGWDVSNTGPEASQYRWPALSVADIKCTGGRSQTNASGVALTRCGADFDSWFETIAPLHPPVSIALLKLPAPGGPTPCTTTASAWGIRSGDYGLGWQEDGNLVLYGPGGTSPTGSVWASDTDGTGDKLCWQGDGNLVIYNSSNQSVWASNTANTERGGNGGRLLILSSNGLLQITDLSGYTIWHVGPFK